MQNKRPVNQKGQRHGLWELYHDNGRLHIKGLFVNGNQFGQHINYWSNGNFLNIENYIDGWLHGYYKFNCGKYTEIIYYAR